MTGSDSVNSRKEVILTSTGKEYVVERLKNNTPLSETLLSPLLVEEDEDEEVPL